MPRPKYPTSKKTAVVYAEHLTKLHGKKFIPIERKNHIKNKHAINFAAVEDYELEHYMNEGWEVIELSKSLESPNSAKAAIAYAKRLSDW